MASPMEPVSRRRNFLGFELTPPSGRDIPHLTPNHPSGGMRLPTAFFIITPAEVVRFNPASGAAPGRGFGMQPTARPGRGERRPQEVRARRNPASPGCMPQGLSRPEGRRAPIQSAIGLAARKGARHDEDRSKHLRNRPGRPSHQQPPDRPRLHPTPHRNLAPQRALRQHHRLGWTHNFSRRHTLLRSPK